MQHKDTTMTSLAVGGILAGWEIDPGWAPRDGDTVTVEFTPAGGSGQVGAPVAHRVPAKTAVTIGPFHILAAAGMRAGGRGLSQAVTAAAKRAADGWGKGT